MSDNKRCARCKRKGTVKLVTIRPGHESWWWFCDFHAERVTYILNCYIMAPGHIGQAP